MKLQYERPTCHKLQVQQANLMAQLSAQAHQQQLPVVSQATTTPTDYQAYMGLPQQQQQPQTSTASHYGGLLVQQQLLAQQR